MMTILQSLLVVSIVLFVYYAWKILNWVWFRPKRLQKRLRHLGFSGNSYRLLFGDLKDMIKMTNEAKSKPMNFSNDIVARVLPSFHKILTKYGKDCFLWLGPKPTILMFDTDIIREVLAKSYVFQKPVNPALELLVRGLATYETDKWAQHRRLITPSFHLDKLKKMLPCFRASCCDMLSKWEKVVAGEGVSELDVWPYLETLTSDVISRSAFGSSYEEGRKIFDLQKEQAELVVRIHRLNLIPGFRFLPTKVNRRMKNIQKQVESLILGIIKKRVKKIDAGEVCSDDLLGILMESNSKEIQQHGHKSGMSFKDVIDECKLFYFAGQETTSSLLVWTMIVLSKHLDWQSRAREEVLEAFGTGEPEFQQLNSLNVVTMILHEVLRLYPPIIMISRMTGENGTLSKLNDLPAGVQIILPILLLHHDCKLWGDDAEEFNPERFSEGVANATKGQLIYFPFGWGPRICIGQSFAMLEAKMALAMILQRYSFQLSPSYSHSPHTVVTLQPQHGAHLSMKKLRE